jgi:hypothetical protein
MTKRELLNRKKISKTRFLRENSASAMPSMAEKTHDPEKLLKTIREYRES